MEFCPDKLTPKKDIKGYKRMLNTLRKPDSKFLFNLCLVYELNSFTDYIKNTK